MRSEGEREKGKKKRRMVKEARPFVFSFFCKKKEEGGGRIRRLSTKNVSPGQKGGGEKGLLVDLFAVLSVFYKKGKRGEKETIGMARGSGTAREPDEGGKKSGRIGTACHLIIFSVLYEGKKKKKKGRRKRGRAVG